MNQTSTTAPIWRVRAMPDSLDCHGRVRAGWLMEQLDLAGGFEAERLTGGQVAVVAINTFQFRAPVLPSNMVNIYAECLRIGQKSLTLKISVSAESATGELTFVTEVIVTYVALDTEGKSRLIANN
jgi:acyl-CoA thioesterase YciA